MYSYEFYHKAALDIWDRYIIPYHCKLNKNYILEVYPSHPNGVFGTSRHPNTVFIYPLNIQKRFNSLGISGPYEKEYVLTTMILAMIHEVLHLEQDISMLNYMSNEEYKSQIEAQVEYESVSRLKHDSDLIMKLFGFTPSILTIDFGYSGEYHPYKQVDVMKFYLNTIINIILQDNVNGFEIIRPLVDDMNNVRHYENISIRFSSTDSYPLYSKNSSTIYIKMGGEYLMSSISGFSFLVDTFCSRWNGYRVSTTVSEPPYRDETERNLMITFTISNRCVSPMLFEME